MSSGVTLDTSSGLEGVALHGAEAYTGKQEEIIRDAQSVDGMSLAKAVEANVSLGIAEVEYQLETGIPKKNVDMQQKPAQSIGGK